MIYIAIQSYIIWWLIGIYGFLYWWSREYITTRKEILFSLWIGIMGPLTWIVGWNIHHIHGESKSRRRLQWKMEIERKKVNRKFRRMTKGSYGATEPGVEIKELDIKDEEVVITSEIDGTNYHAPVIDIDYNASLIPSSTPGHFHLYLDKKISKSKYMAFLAVMAEVGLIEKGFSNASQSRGYSAVRPPWVKKK